MHNRVFKIIEIAYHEIALYGIQNYFASQQLLVTIGVMQQVRPLLTTLASTSEAPVCTPFARG